MNKITPFLWFDNNAEEAVNFYTSIFKDSQIFQTNRYEENAPGTDTQVSTISFQLMGQQFTALNGGPYFKFTPAISFYVECEDQAEVDYYWEKLSAGGNIEQCGWLTDRYGLSWQIIPKVLIDLMNDENPKKANNVRQVMLTMKKIDIEILVQAFQNES